LPSWGSTARLNVQVVDLLSDEIAALRRRASKLEKASPYQYQRIRYRDAIQGGADASIAKESLLDAGGAPVVGVE